jgi:hypothetical protein
MMQVAAEDTYQDYVICRGFDPRILYFIDYEEGNPEKPGISVAKPYGKRKKGQYKIGEMYPALLPTQGINQSIAYTPPSPIEVEWRLGQNPGVANDENPFNPVQPGGQPDELSDVIDLMKDHNDLYVNWMLIDSSGGTGVIRFRLREELRVCQFAKAIELDDGCEDDDEADEILIFDTLATANFTVNEFGDWMAPEGSIGFARKLPTPDPLYDQLQYELIYIDWGCCYEEECLQIPKMPFAAIPEGIPKWALGYDENGCLIKFPVAICIPCEPIQLPDPQP